MNNPINHNQSCTFLYAHTHWDREWYLTFRQYQSRLLGVMDEIFYTLDTGLLPSFTLDGQTVLLDDYLALRPDNKSKITSLVQAGKLDIGPWYVMPDEFLVSGESLIRNLKKGINDATSFGARQFTGYLPDTFGHSQDIPSILQGFNIDTAIVWRGICPENPAFYWQSPDKSAVNTYHLSDGYFQMMLQDVDLDDEQKIHALTDFEQKLQKLHTTPLLIPIGGDHLGLPQPEILNRVKNTYPDLLWTTTTGFMNTHLKPALETMNSPATITGELTDNSAQFILPGVYSSRLYLKAENRKLEHQLTHIVEPLMSMTKSLNPESFQNRQAMLDEGWRQLLLNHPHDSICGCSTDEVHQHNEVRFQEVRNIADCLIDDCTRDVLATQDHNEHWIVVNTGSLPYTGVVKMREESTESSRLPQVEREETHLIDQWRFDARQVPLSHKTETVRHGWLYAENLPPFSINTLKKDSHSLPAEKSVSAEDNSLENEFYTFSITPEGTLSVTDKQTDKTYSTLLQFSVRKEQGDSYNGAPIPNSPVEMPKLISTEVLHSGSLVSALTLTHQLDEQVWKTTVTLKASEKFIHFETAFTNTLSDVCVQVGFETDRAIQTVLAETHLGTVERHYDSDYNITQHMPAPKDKELKTNTGVIQRFIATNGQYFVTEGLTEYEVNKNTLKLTLLRTFDKISSPETGVRGTQAGPPFETPEGQCLNRAMAFRYGWCPDPQQAEERFHLASRFYGETVAFDSALLKPESKPANSIESPEWGQALVHWENDTIIKSACYPTTNGYILRLLNTGNQNQTITLNFQKTPASMETVNLMEVVLDSLDDHQVSFKPHQLISLKITSH